MKLETTTQGPPIESWLAESVDRNVVTAIERMRRFDDVRRIAVMPDVHVASDVCVGTVMATSRLLYPAAVGGDIGCGMLAAAFDASADDLRQPKRAGEALRMLYSSVPGSRRHRTRTVPMPESFANERLSHSWLDAVAREDGALHLGTLGGGNHFIEFQSDDADGRLWVMIHSGSRAMGAAIRAHHVAAALARDPSRKPPALDASTDAGQAYLHDAGWACAFADANRRAMMSCIEAVIGEVLDAKLDALTTIAVDHNHVCHEEHFGENLFVHRKGAMPADAGAAGVLPGSMGTLSYHVEGRGLAESMRSSAHGAGRKLSRAAARDRFTPADVKHQLRNVWYDPRQTQALREEAPHAYKDVRAVLRAQESLVRVTRTLRPVLSYKSG